MTENGETTHIDFIDPVYNLKYYKKELRKVQSPENGITGDDPQGITIKHDIMNFSAKVGACYATLGKHKLALKYYKLALSYYKIIYKLQPTFFCCAGIPMLYWIADSYNKLSYTYKSNDNYSKAREYNTKSLRYYIKIYDIYKKYEDNEFFEVVTDPKIIGFDINDCNELIVDKCILLGYRPESPGPILAKVGLTPEKIKDLFENDPRISLVTKNVVS
jgi:tetratricopeptide (TPR) repeat protein